MNGSVYAHRSNLYRLLSQGLLSDEVLNLLLPDGEPMDYERQLWDYKLELPCLPAKREPSPEETAGFNGALAELIKDSAAFYNSYGGYIVAGVRDVPREIVGFSGAFDCDTLNKRIKAATGYAIECFYKTFERAASDGSLKELGVIYIPQRLDGLSPVQFLKDAAPKLGGKKVYGQKDIYFRKGDECCKAEASQDYVFLCTPGRRVFAPLTHTTISPVLGSNLGARDESFIEFVGRETYLASLWKWFFDKFSPVRLLAGIGGVGKTTLAREFAEQVARAAPFGFQKVIWLSAKKRAYSAVQGKALPIARVDFDNVDGLLRQICLELALTEQDVPEDLPRDALLEATVDALTQLPALVVVDDVDSLEQEQQQDLFHALISIFSQTISTSPVGSRALLTARLDLGAAPRQVIRVKGLEFDEFRDFIYITCDALEIHATRNKVLKRLERFHTVAEGSPMFASSILRLVSLGEDIDRALVKWERTDGEEVRRFAFERELEQLSDTTRRVLFALCILGESSLVELAIILTRSEQQIRDDVGELRQYHLILHGGSHMPGGTQIAIPGTIRMMRPILREKINDPTRIETSCSKARSATRKASRDVRPDVNRIVSLWANDQAQEAHDLAINLENQFPEDGDVRCLVGRSFLRLREPNYRKADISFRKAQEMGCKRPELIPLWVDAKAALGDWNGLLEITAFKGHDLPNADILVARADAYRELSEMDRKAGSIRSAAETLLDGGKEIDKVFGMKKAAGAVEELRQRRREFLTMYVELIDRLTANADEHIDVWLAVVTSFECFVRSPRLVRLGAQKLLTWWRSVESRAQTSPKTADVMEIQLRRLGDMVAAFREHDSSDDRLLQYLDSCLNDLYSRLSVYRDKLG
jgi:hypothetical protein